METMYVANLKLTTPMFGLGCLLVLYVFTPASSSRIVFFFALGDLSCTYCSQLYVCTFTLLGFRPGFGLLHLIFYGPGCSNQLYECGNPHVARSINRKQKNT